MGSHWESFLINVGWRKPTDAATIDALRFTHWKSWVAGGVAFGVISVLRAVWH